jgi:hypothetical protein
VSKQQKTENPMGAGKTQVSAGEFRQPIEGDRDSTVTPGAGLGNPELNQSP